MKLLIFSDIHLEFHNDGGIEFIKSQSDVDYDICIIAGDITDYKGLISAYSLLADSFKDIIFVQGNHECYGGSIQKAKYKAIEACEKYSNLHFLDNSEVTINNQRFIGCTLWFKDHASNFMYSHGMNDFFQIEDFKNTVYVENENSLQFLNKELQSDDIVLTHHLPSYECIDEQYKNSPLNRFFVCELDELIIEREPKLIIGGHTHCNYDFNLYNTRLVCNPFGYKEYDTNPKFKSKFVIDI